MFMPSVETSEILHVVLIVEQRPRWSLQEHRVPRVVKARNHVSVPEFVRGILSVDAIITTAFFKEMRTSNMLGN